MAEWSNAAVLKTVVPSGNRGFESLFLRKVLISRKDHKSSAEQSGLSLAYNCLQNPDSTINLSYTIRVFLWIVIKSENSEKRGWVPYQLFYLFLIIK